MSDLLDFHSSASLEAQVGQMIVAGFPAGSEGLKTFQSLISETSIGNAILFSRNLGSPESIYKTVLQVKKIILDKTGILPLISIDQEGGMASRILDGMTMIPGAMAQAAAYEGGQISLKQVEELGYITGKELAVLGINWNLAPVADVNNNPLNPIIGTRSFGENPNKTAQLVCAFTRGLKSSGIMACAKHFPGHGDTFTDSHLALPLVRHSRDRLNEIELKPFQALIQTGIDSIMSAHILFPEIEKNKLPATLSKKILTDLLRNELGFSGLVVTDCLEMQAIANNYPDAAVQAIEAGADLIFVSHTAMNQKKAQKDILLAVQTGRISEERIHDSFQRILKKKADLIKLENLFSHLEILQNPKAEEICRRTAQGALTLCSGNSFDFLKTENITYLDILPDALTKFEEIPQIGQHTISGYLKDSNVSCQQLSMEPNELQQQQILNRLKDSSVVVGLFALSNNLAQQEFIKKLSQQCKKYRKKIAFIAMRNPWDISLARNLIESPESPGLIAWEYTPTSAKAVADFLLGKIKALGKLPVTL